MKKKSIIALLLCLVLAVSAGCSGVEVKGGDSETSSGGATTAGGDNAPIKLTLLAESKNEKIANIVRDLLTKQGFEITMSLQTDYGSYAAQAEGGNFDIIVCSWGTPTGSPDYAINNIMRSDGSNNLWKCNDPELDALIDAASQADPEDWTEMYGAVERQAVETDVFMTPLYREIKGRGVSNLLDSDSTRVLSVWQDNTYVDASLNDTRPVVHATTGFSLNTFDPIRADNSSIGSLANNLYIRLVDLTDDYEYTTDGTLSYNYAISEDNQAYYFILRDDCFFSRVNANGEAVLTDHMVAGEDAVYSVTRMYDRDSVPSQAVYSNNACMEKAELITDVTELQNTVTAHGTTVYDELTANLPAELASLVATRDEVDNAAGSYQVLKITTKYPYPQVLNNLCQHAGGIVDSEWVESINSQVDFASYDPNSDVLYADTNTMVKGSNFNNTISCSGPYVLLHMDDYGVYLEKNEGYRQNDGGAKIRYLNYVNLADSDAAISALRSGDVDYVWSVPAEKFDTVKNDENLTLCEDPSNRVYYMTYNTTSENSPCYNLTVRQAIAASINQDDIIAALGGNALPAYSTISAVYDCGNTFTYTEGKAQELLQEYYAEQAAS